MRAGFLTLVALSTPASGCLAPAWDDVTDHFTSAGAMDSTTLMSTTGEATPTTSAGTGVQTATSATSTTTTGTLETTSSSGSTAPPEENSPPMVGLVVKPAHLDEAGTADLVLDASSDVVTVRVLLDGEPLAQLTPADFPFTAFEAFSAKDNTVNDHVFEVEVEDAEGLTAHALAKLSVELPASGAQKCIFDKDKENPAVVASVMSAIVYTEAAIVAVGARDLGAGKRMTIWKLDPNHCEETLPGWPKTIADWTADPNFDTMASEAKAVAVDEDGNIALGGNLLVAGNPQRYTAFLTEDGGRLWERAGLSGEEVSSVVIAANGLVISGGWKFTSVDPPRTDAVFWRHMPDNTVWKTTLKAPFTLDEVYKDDPNLLSERIQAMLIEPGTGFLVVAGDREFTNNLNNIYPRGFLARFVPLGGPVGSPSTSPGDAYLRDAVYSLAVCGDTLITGGWTRENEDPNVTPPQPLFRWASNGVWSGKLVEPILSTELRGVACDREGKVIGAGLRSAGGYDARVFAFAGPLGPRTWYETGTVGNDIANGMVCDARGFCAWPGSRTYNGKPVAVVRVHHP